MEKSIDTFCYSNEDFIPRNHLRGYVFTADELIFGVTGLLEYKKKKNLYDKCEFGRFLLFEVVGNRTVVRVDPAGQEILYYYKKNDSWVIGNSLLLVVEKLRRLGVEIKPYKPAIDLFKVSRLEVSDGQLASFNTPISDIKMLPKNRMFVIVDEGEDRRLDVRFRLLLEDVKHDCSGSYEEVMWKFCSNWMSRASALIRSKVPISLSLSGGVDSRACLSFFMNDRLPRNEVLTIFSLQSNERDFEIATEIAQLTNMTLWRERQSSAVSINISAVDSFRNSMLAMAGVKANFKTRGSVKLVSDFLCIGGCVVGSNYMKKTLNSHKKWLIEKNKNVADIVADEVEGALSEMGVSYDDPLAMFHHYHSFRARFHYGVDVYTSQLTAQIHPLLDRDLISAVQLCGKGYSEKNGVIRDVVAVLNPSLLGINFDRPDKVPNFNFSKLPNIRDLNFVDYDLYGDFETAYLSPEFDEFIGGDEEFNTEMEGIMKLQSDVVYDVGIEFGFSEEYISTARDELENPRGELKRAGVLVGLGSLLQA